MKKHNLKQLLPTRFVITVAVLIAALLLLLAYISFTKETASSKELSATREELLGRMEEDSVQLETFEQYVNDEVLSSVSSQETKIQNNTDSISNLKGNLNSAKTELSNLSGDVNNTKTELSNLSGDVNNTKTELSNLSGDVNNTKTELSNLSGDVSTAKTAIEGLTGSISNTQEQVSSVQGRVNEISNYLADSCKVIYKEEEDAFYVETETANGTVSKKLGFAE